VRILQLHTRYRQSGGEDAVVQAERDALERAGHRVLQHIEHNPTGTAEAALALAGSVWNVRAARRVAQAILQFRPDVAHLHNTWFALSPAVLAPLRRHQIPTIMTVHNYRLICTNSLFLRAGKPCESCLDRSTFQAVRHRCYRDSAVMSAIAATGISVHARLGTWARGVDRFIVLSDFAQSRLVRAGLPVSRLVRGGNFVPDPGPRTGPPSTSDTVLFVGRISAEKGLPVLLRAWRDTAVPDLRLDVIGDGPDRTRLERDAPAGVRFLGRRPSSEVLARVSQARALVIPSIWYEGQPMVALEGMAAGTPLLLSEIGGLPEVLGGTSGGWTFPAGETRALGRLLRSEVADAVEVDQRGRLARQVYLDSFTPEAAVRRLEDTYRGVAHRVAS
jgi:glycosyltransferase involved in cell wall biosynthesis